MISNGRNYARSSPIDWMRAVLWLLSRVVLYGAAVAGAIYVVGRLKVVIIYVVLAIVLAYIMRPMADWAARRHILVPSRVPYHAQRAIATLYVLVLMFVAGYFGARFVISPFVAQVKEVGQNWQVKYRPRLEEYTSSVKTWYANNVSPAWQDKIEKTFHQTASASNGGENQKQALTLAGEVGRVLAEVAHQVVEIVLLPVLAFYFALDSRKLKREFVGVLPRRRWRETLRMIFEFNQIMHSYVVGQAILCVIAGVVVGGFLELLHVPFALTLGVLAGITRAIPIIGPIIGGIPIILLTLVTSGPQTALVVLAFFTFLHFAESKFLMPTLIGDRMELHPVLIILVLLVGQEFFGLLGMFFAPPVAALIRVIVRRYWLRARAYRQPGMLESLETTATTVPVGLD